MLFPYSLSLADLRLHKKNWLKKKFIASLQNNSWQYWPHFQTIQPNASAKGKNTFQPSLSSSDIGQSQPPMSINDANPASPAVTPPSSNVMSVDPILAAPAITAMNIDPIPSTPAITNKRPFINLDSDSETRTEGDRFAPSSTLIGSTGLTVDWPRSDSRTFQTQSKPDLELGFRDQVQVQVEAKLEPEVQTSNSK